MGTPKWGGQNGVQKWTKNGPFLAPLFDHPQWPKRVQNVHLKSGGNTVNLALFWHPNPSPKWGPKMANFGVIFGPIFGPQNWPFWGSHFGTPPEQVLTGTCEG